MLIEHVPSPSRFPLLKRQHPVIDGTTQTCVLVVLRGIAGSGKTVFADQLLDSRREAGDRVYLVAEPFDGGIEDFAELDRFFKTDQTPVTLLIDNCETLMADTFAGSLVALLNRHHHLRVVASGRQVHGLDERQVLLQLPACMLTEEDLFFSAEEAHELLQTWVPRQPESRRFAASMQAQTAGWPRATVIALSSIMGSAAGGAALSAGTDGLANDIISDVLSQATEVERAVLLLAAITKLISAGIVSTILDCSRQEAELALAKLSSSVLLKRPATGSEQSYQMLPLIQRVLWRRRRDYVSSEQSARWAERVVLLEQGFPDQVTDLGRMFAIIGENWSLLDRILTNHYSEELIVPPPALREAIVQVPAAVRQQYPAIAFLALIEEFTFPRAQHARLMRDLEFLAAKGLNTESLKVGMRGVMAGGMRLAAARLTRNSDVLARMLRQLGEQIGRLSEAEMRLGQGTLSVVEIQVGITLLMQERFTEADQVLQTVRHRQLEQESLSWLHATSVWAFVAAWQGDLVEAGYRWNEIESLIYSKQWISHFVTVNAWLAKAMIELEKGDVDAAADAFERIAWRVDTIEIWPYLVWVKAHIIEAQLGGAQALAYVLAQVAAHGRLVAPPLGMQKVLDEVLARLAWQTGRHQVLLKRRNLSGLSTVYSAFSDGLHERAGYLAAGVAERAAQQHGIREQVRALLLRVISEHELGDDRAEKTRKQARAMMGQYGLQTPLLERPPWWDVDSGQVMAGVAISSGGQAGSRSSGSTQIMVVSTGAGGSEQLEQVSTVPEQPESPASPSRRPIGALTPAEIRTLQVVARAGTTPKAAKELNLSVHTVRDQMKSVHRKLGVSSRAEAIRRAYATGILQPEVSP